MIARDEIKRLCNAPGDGKAYFRPFICKGDLSKADIFLIGTNPATPIYPHDINLDEYVDLLFDYDRFIEYYKKSRILKGKSEISRTRVGMNSFINWLACKSSSSVIETDAIPYPTEKLKMLWKEPDSIVESGKEVFYELLLTFKPRLLILHGKETTEQIFELLLSKGLIQSSLVSCEQTIEEIESKVPLMTFKYPNEKTGVITACRHFMYYGSTGNSYSEFRNNIGKLL